MSKAASSLDKNDSNLLPLMRDSPSRSLGTKIGMSADNAPLTFRIGRASGSALMSSPAKVPDKICEAVRDPVAYVIKLSQSPVFKPLRNRAISLSAILSNSLARVFCCS